MQETISKILNEKVIMIVRSVPSDKILPLAESMYRGGIRLMECTYDASGNTPDEEVAENIAKLSEHFKGRMFIGAGTVLNEKQVRLTKEAGGKFIISPDTNPNVINETKKQGLVSIPGALTPSEAVTAHNVGADFVKLFPISQMGASYLKALRAPLSHIRFLAVGGVNEENLGEYMRNGALGVGIGVGASEKLAIMENNFEYIEEKCRRLTYIAKSE